MQKTSSLSLAFNVKYGSLTKAINFTILQNLRRMALWHIPLFQERSPLDTIFDDVFDMSFSPRYYRHFYIPYNKYHTKKNAGGGKSQGESFKISLDVRDYRPEDISLKVDGDKLLVKGKRCKESEFGYEKSEFDRTYPIPSDVDAEGFKSKLNDDGVLEIEAPKKVKQEELEAIVEPTQQDENKFKAIFDVTQYKPEEVSVKVQGNRVVIHGEQKSDSKDDDKEVFSHHRQFVRRIVLPETVKLDSLQSKWTKDGKLVIEADKIPTIEAECRQLEIKHECDEGSKAE